MEIIQRTIRIKLCPSPGQAALLSKTVELFTACFNQVVEIAEREKLTNGIELHKLTYAQLRATTSLPSQLICAARVKATEAVKSVVVLRKKGKKAKSPKSKNCAIRYDARSYKFDRANRTVSLLHIQQPGKKHNRAVVSIFIPLTLNRILVRIGRLIAPILLNEKTVVSGCIW